MFKIEPNTIYTATDLIELSGYSPAAVYEWFKDGLRHRGGSRTKATTGKALLEYFEKDCTEDETVDPKLQAKLIKAGAY